MEHNRFEGSVVPFARRWHVVQEVDLVRLVGAHHRRIDLCVRLEEIADALPALPTDAEVEALCRALVEIVSGDEREELPFLEEMLLHGHETALAVALLDHIRVRHASDAAGAAEVLSALRSPADQRLGPEALGYLLRSAFVTCRRAVDFEQLAILALAGPRLTEEARDLLVRDLSLRAVA